jgi:Tol biopolymer transport system component/DNA-binding winged helix-turn-helix (wHTH) protein
LNLQPIREFGPFRLDLDEQAITKDGQSLQLTPKEFALLALLVSRAGQLVSKDEILATVWPQTVVEESNLAVHVSALRRILGESASSPTYIETIPRRGYRFIAPVREIGPVPPLPDSAGAPATPSKYNRALLAILIAGFAAVAVRLIWLAAARRAEMPWKPLPLTSTPGLELTPALSPDASQVVFAGPVTNPGLMLITVGADGMPARLTSQADYNPTWSPDGREIAFVRFHVEPEVYAELMVRPSFGGPDRALRRLDYFGPSPGPSLSYSPDGQWIFTTLGTGILPGLPPRKIVAIGAKTGELREVLKPVSGSSGDWAPAISPAGDRLVFSRCGSPQACNLFEAKMNGLAPVGDPRQLTFQPSPEIRSVFLPDGSLVYSQGPQRANTLWRLSRNLLGRSRVQQISENGEDAIQPSAARLSNGTVRIVYVRSMVDVNIWEETLDGPDGKATGAAPLISSTRMEETPAYSPDGLRVAFASTRGGTWEIWTCNSSDGQNCSQVTRLGPSYSRAPSWSPDGKWIAFDSRPSGNAQIFVVPARGGEAKQVTFGETAATDPCWSSDGKWIYFAATRSGRFEIYRSPAYTPETRELGFEQLTKNGGASPRLSGSGDSLMYRGLSGEFFRMDLTTLAIHQLPDVAAISTPLPGAGTLAYGYLFDAGRRLGFVARFDWKTSAIEYLRPTTLDRPSGLARSPDGRRLLYVRTDQNEADLMVADSPGF